ncbi:MAG: hypothetical protein ACAH95_14005 [Fimbriimonas sp.]
MPAKALSGRVDFRAFSGREDLVYTGLGINYGLGNGLEGILRGSFAPNRTTGLVRHGGSDVELAVKLRPQSGSSPYAVLIGVALPNTSTQTKAVATAGLMAGFGNEKIAGYLNPRAVFLDRNTLVGIGIGGSARLDKNLRLIADVTALVSGENTRDTATGQRLRRTIYGAALRYTASANYDFTIDLGVANGTGSTTGFGLTPGLNNSAAVFLALTIRR